MVLTRLWDTQIGFGQGYSLHNRRHASARSPFPPTSASEVVQKPGTQQGELGAEAALAPGRRPGGRKNARMDISRSVAETGFKPEFDIAATIADYVDWLLAGNEF